MKQLRVGIVQTGTANIASVLAALRRAQVEAYLLNTAEELQKADRVVLPGVGAFGAAMESLTAAELTETLTKRIREERPTLAICLGLQLLCSQSEESPDATGLDLLDATVQRFSPSLRVPQFGWSAVQSPNPDSFFEPGFAYFANSYCLPSAPSDWDVAYAEYGASYVASMRKGGVVACQFHPELSGIWGHRLIQRWLAL